MVGALVRGGLVPVRDCHRSSPEPARNHLTGGRGVGYQSPSGVALEAAVAIFKAVLTA